MSINPKSSQARLRQTQIINLNKLIILLKRISHLQSNKILKLKEENSRFRERLSLYEHPSVTRKYIEVSERRG